MVRLAALAGLIVGTVVGFQAIAWGYARALGREGLVRRPSDRLGEPVATVPLVRGTTLVHRFVVDADHWVGFGVRTITWGHFPRPGRCSWVLYELNGSEAGRVEVRRGSFRAARLRDGTIFPVRFDEVADSAGKSYELEFSGPDVALEETVGLPIYRTAGEASVRLEAGTVPPLPAERLALDLGPIHRPGRGRHDRIVPR